MSPEAAPGISAVFFDGTSSRRREVGLRLAQALEVSENGIGVASWPYDTIRRVDHVGAGMRLRATGAADLARLDINDWDFEGRLAARCPRLDEDSPGSVSVSRIVFWSLAAAASILLIAIFGLPLLADRITPLVPVALEKRLGDVADKQVKAIFGNKTCTGAAGQAALHHLIAELEAKADLPVAPDAVVLRSSVPNAFALPGGKVYILEGLLQKAESPDELAGVLAHELGHVHNRDGLRRIIQTGGTSYMIGLLFGDVTGSGAALFISRELLNSSYSREAEARADAFSATVMQRLGRPVQPLGNLLVRLTGNHKAGMMDMLASHPVSADRLAALKQVNSPETGPPLMAFGDWRALRNICKPQG